MVPARSGLPARSVAAVEVVHCSVLEPLAVEVGPLGTPRVRVMVLPLRARLDVVKVVFAVTYFLPEVTLPRASWVVLVALYTVITSGLPLVKRTTTGVADPVHPARNEAGSIGSENV